MILAAAAIEPVISLTLIVSPYCAPWFPQHELSNMALIDLLLELQDRRLIVAHDTRPHMKAPSYLEERHYPAPGSLLLDDDEIDLDTWPIFTLTAENIGSELVLGRQIGEYEKKHKDFPDWYFKRKNRLSYQLTEYGGAAWEEASQADWSKFHACVSVSWETADLAPNQHLSYGRSGAATRETLEAYFDWRLRWDNNTDAEDRLKCFTRWHVERVSSWKPKYWKTLPEGFQCDFSEYEVTYTDRKTDRSGFPERGPLRQRCWEEYRALFQWYTDPWK